MKFSEMPYKRPDLEALKASLKDMTARLAAAESYEAARAVFLEQENASRKVETAATLAHIRHTIDTRDEFYDGEMKFWNAAMPELQEYMQAWTMTMLGNAFRKDSRRNTATSCSSTPRSR